MAIARMCARTALSGYMGSYRESVMCVRCVRRRIRAEFSSRRRPNMTDQPCEICGRYGAFGYGPPLCPQSIWRCGEHRMEGPVFRSRPDPVQVMVNVWIEANWPTETDPGACRHCQRKSDDLIPLGYGTRPAGLGASPVLRPLSGRAQTPSPRRIGKAGRRGSRCNPPLCRPVS
jgi:hypothetical protein